MNSQILLNKYEVKKYAFLEASFPLCSIEDICEVVWKEFNDCLGLAFMDQLIGDLKDYSSAENWDYEASYIVGDSVKYEGCYWTAIQANSNNQPTVGNAWELSDKFNTECFNDLWCNGSLAKYLSRVVARFSIVPSSVKMTAAGAVVIRDNGSEPASSSEKKMLFAHHDARIKTAFEKLDYYMNNNNASGCFNKYKGIAVDCCGSCGCEKEKCRCESCLDHKNTWSRWAVG